MRKPSDPLDVLIVGAGPTGLALAAQLERYGARFRLVDRRHDRVHESRALAVQPRTLEVLAGLGTVTDDMVTCGNAAVRLVLHSHQRAVPVDLFDIGVDDTDYPFSSFCPRPRRSGSSPVTSTNAASAWNAAPSWSGSTWRASPPSAPCGTETVRWRSSGRGTSPAATGPTAPYGSSRVFPSRAGPYPQTFVLADVETDGIQPGRVHTFLSTQGILFFFPLGAPATWRVIAMRPRSDQTPVERPVDLADVQGLVDAYTSLPVRVHDPVWMTNFRLHNRGALHYRRGPVFLAGDAAHIHSPAGAQGMNTGIQDAANLGWKLGLVSAGQLKQEVLDTYEPERAPVGRRVLRFTDRAFTVGTSTNAVVGFARTRIAPRVLPVALRVTAGRAYALRTVSQLGIHYRRSPLSQDGPAATRRGPRAGDRLPDAAVSADGRLTTLHRALAAPGLHVLLCGGPTPTWPRAEDWPGPITVHRLRPDRAPGALHDHDGSAARRLGLSTCQAAQFLIRPDGHIGFRAGGTDLTGLRDHLTQRLLP